MEQAAPSVLLPPENFEASAAVAYANSLYDYQFGGADRKAVSTSPDWRGGLPDRSFGVCFCALPGPESAAGNGVGVLRQIAKLRRLSGCRSLTADSFEGRTRLILGWQDHWLIERLFNALLRLGIGFRTANRAAVYFEPATDSFSPEAAERKLIARVEELVASAPLLLCDDAFSRVFLGVWNYLTKEGQHLCARLRQLRRLPPPDWNDPANYLRWPGFKRPRDFFKADEESCMLCLVAPPVMMALPCGHISLCRNCARKLKSSGRRSCIKCTLETSAVVRCGFPGTKTVPM